MAPCRRKTWLILVIDLTVGKFVTILNFIVFGRRVAVGHDPLTQQEGLGLLLPKGEHTSLEVFSL